MEKSESEPIVSWDLISHVENYFRILHDEDRGDFDTRSLIAGEYFKQHIEGQYTDTQLNFAFWAVGK